MMTLKLEKEENMLLTQSANFCLKFFEKVSGMFRPWKLLFCHSMGLLQSKIFTPKLTKCQFQRLIFYTWENDLVQHLSKPNNKQFCIKRHFAAKRIFVGLDDAMIRLPVMPNCPMKYSLILTLLSLWHRKFNWTFNALISYVWYLKIIEKSLIQNYFAITRVEITTKVSNFQLR